MKNALKIAVALVFVFTLTVAVFAAEGSLITYKWVDMSEYNENGELAYDLTLNVQAVGTEQLRQYRTDITFNNELLIPVSCGDYATPVDLVDGSSVDSIDPIWTPEVVVGSGKNKKTYTYDVPDYSWTTNGNKTTLKLTVSTTGFDYFDYSDLDFATVAFKLADGKTLDDITYSDITIDFIQFFAGQDENGNGIEYGLNEPRMPEPVNYVNELAPEAPVVAAITIPVLVGDKVYLQDGTVATMAEANDAYEVPATVGYVAVNTGKTAQKTYYVDGTAATLVHTNGIVSTEENALRGPDEKSSVADDTSGLRFLMNHNPTNRTATGHEITEIGVLMTVESNKVIAGIGQETIDNLKVGNVGTFVKSGYALGNGYDRAFKTENDTNWVISAVMYGIKLNAANVQVNIVCRPFYKVGDTYIYGETMKATLYDVAKSIKDGGYVGCSDELKAYVDEIVTLVDGVDTPVVEGEVIIDISSLYTIVG